MKSISKPFFFVVTILLLNFLYAIGQIKSIYTPFEYSADTSQTICISEFQRDSFKYEILYYRDILEETKRSYLISQNSSFVDTIFSNEDSLVIHYYTKERNLLFRKVFEYRKSNQDSYFLSEFYYLDSGRISYSSRSIIPSNTVNELNGINISEDFTTGEQLQTRSRYVYDKSGGLNKVIVEIRIGGAGIRLLELKNDKRINQKDYRKFPSRKITIWEFWD